MLHRGCADRLFREPARGSRRDRPELHPDPPLPRTRYYHDVLVAIGAPVSQRNIQACLAWQAAEGGSASWNPWNTTQPAKGAKNYNSAGVKNYPNREVGIGATVKTLTNGRYGDVIREFRANRSGLAVCRRVDASPWGTKHAASVYRDRYGNS